MRNSLRIFLALTVTAAIAGCGDAFPSALEVSDLAKRAGDAVWSVQADGCGWRAKGTAFAIDERHLVTNQHVIANDSSPTIRSREGESLDGRVIGATVDPDVAIIEVKEDLPVSLPWADTKSLKKHEPLIVLGYPSPKNAFKTSTGQIVDFHPTGSREAALSDAPIAHGNSGGPGLRADASVAGLVTLMTLREKPEDSVAILFTADKVRPSVERFLENPKDVLSSCGLGPDYVPEVPKDFEIDEAPATAAPVDVVPVATEVAKSKPKALASVAPTPTEIAPTPLPKCPNGGPVVKVERVSSTPESPGWWTVTVEGVITSFGSYDMTLQRLQVHVDGNPPADGDVRITPTTIGPGRTATWGRELSVYSPAGEPTQATANLEWAWAQGNYDWCETDAVTAVGPKQTPAPAPAAAQATPVA